MSVPSHFKVQPFLFANPLARKALWAVGGLLLAAAGAMSGLIGDSMIERPPTGQIAGLNERLEEARASGLGEFAATELDQVQTALDAALTTIAVERGKPWTLKSYDRARSLVGKAQLIFDSAEDRFERQTRG